MLTIAVPKEVSDSRVALTPETVQQLVKNQCSVVVQAGAGSDSFYSDDAYKNAGATMEKDTKKLFSKAQVILKVVPPTSVEVSLSQESTLWIAFGEAEEDAVKKLAAKKASYLSLSKVPRITRAQKMDALSSQSNIAGYKAVIMAANELPKIFPLMMTAAGTLTPAKVVVLGAGVAGLQAIATAKRLGAQVEASDVRPAVKEQVESLGAKFIEVPFDKDAEDKGGYAKGASPEFLKRQAEEVKKRISAADVVICTALVPGKKAPVLVTEEMVKSMRPGSVIVDMAAVQGGNCALTKPGKTALFNGVKILGVENIPGSVATHASQMYAKNIMNLLLACVKEGKLTLDVRDEIIAGALLLHEGKAPAGGAQ